jgi:hypothetical protein
MNFLASAVAAPFFVWVVVALLVVAGYWKMFEKAALPGWGAIVPIYNSYLICKTAGRSGWWVLLLFIPIVGIIAAIILMSDISKRFDKSLGFTLGLIFLSPIFVPILGFGSAEYR